MVAAADPSEANVWTVPPIDITDDERDELERRALAYDVPMRAAKRAAVILAAAQGMSNRRIATEVGLSEEYVAMWRRRFVTERLQGLQDRPRSGRPRVYDHDARRKVVAIATSGGQGTGGRWSHRVLAENLGDLDISASQVGRILAEHGSAQSTVGETATRIEAVKDRSLTTSGERA